MTIDERIKVMCAEPFKPYDIVVAGGTGKSKKRNWPCRGKGVFRCSE